MNETNIRVCLIVFHFHLFVVGLWWMQGANSFGFKRCIVGKQCISCMTISTHLTRYFLFFRLLSYSFIHQWYCSSLSKTIGRTTNDTILVAKVNTFALHLHWLYRSRVKMMRCNNKKSPDTNECIGRLMVL